MGLLAAFQFLTLLPVKQNFTPRQIGRSTVYFPVVGIVIGLALSGLNYLLSLILPSAAVNVFLVATLAISSGGLHLDGLADTLDGIAGHRSVEKRLEIMRDSRIGGMGAIGIALFLLVEYVLLHSIPGQLKLNALVLAPVLSRWAMVNAIFIFPYARPSGLGRVFKDHMNWQKFALATLVALILTVVLFTWSGLVIMAGTWIIIILIGMFLTRQLKGLTGDSYGAINEVAALTVFFMVVMLAFKDWRI